MKRIYMFDGLGCLTASAVLMLGSLAREFGVSLCLGLRQGRSFAPVQGRTNTSRTVWSRACPGP